MVVFLVTVKLPRNPAHDPNKKQRDVCPVEDGSNSLCTDTTGQHHTVLWLGEDMEQARLHWSDLGYHVTRVEKAYLLPPI